MNPTRTKAVLRVLPLNRGQVSALLVRVATLELADTVQLKP